MSLPALSYEALRAFCYAQGPSPEAWGRALRLAGVMRWFAEFRGRGDEADAWASAGLLRGAALDDDALEKAGADGALRSILRRKTVADADAQAPLTPEEEFCCLLVTLDSLSELVAATAVAVRQPRGSVKNLKVSAVAKKFRESGFGGPRVNRMAILQGARRMRWEIGNLTSKTIKAVLSCEDEVTEAVEELEDIVFLKESGQEDLIEKMLAQKRIGKSFGI